MELTRISRPVNFESYIGNQDVVNLLRISVANREVAPKTILAGHVGIGKSSLALLMALAMQCENNMNGNPCLECPNCKEIVQSLILNNENCCNIYRFNSSDKNGVDDMKELTELFSRKKSKKYNYLIIILEEPQRLSINAQDYLNVPLEYLPEHIKIFFTTSELDSISKAIQSRSAIYHLKIPPMQETVELLQNIIKINYNKEVPKQMLELIVEYSNNVPRDSVGNLERILQKGELSVNAINRILGTLDFEHYINFFSIVHKDIILVAKFLSDLKTKGVNYTDFVANLHIFMTDVFKMKFNIPCNRYTKQQYKACKDLFSNYSYNEFLRMQILSTELAVATTNNRYYNERLAESMLYEFALKVNQKFDIDNYFKDTSNDHALAIKAHQEKDLEKFKETKPTSNASINEILSEVSTATKSDIKIVRDIGKIEVSTDTNIIY